MGTEVSKREGLADSVAGYCQWLADQGQLVKIRGRLEMARKLGVPAESEGELRALEKMSAFKTYRSELVQGNVAEAKEVFQSRSVRMAEDFFTMADLAMKNGDYDKWIKYGGPFLNRIWAERGDTQVNTQVVINLGSGFASKVQEAEYEVVVNPG